MNCPNCNGAIDSNGKCICCGYATRMNLSAKDGKVIYGSIAIKELESLTELTQKHKLTEEEKKIIEAWNNAKGGYCLPIDDIIKAMENKNG